MKNGLCSVWSSRLGAFAAAGAVILCACLPGTAHEEDWRKLRDRKPPFHGPAVTGMVHKVVPSANAGISGPQGGGAGGGGGILRGTYPAQGVEMLAHLPLNVLGGGANANDCWGYTSPAGREYAIMGSNNGTHFVEVTDPINPVIVSFVDGPDSLWRDVCVRGHYCYTGSEGGGGVQVIDLANIDAATDRVRFVQSVFTGGHTRTHTMVVNEDEPTPYLYLCGTNLGAGAVLAMSLADPENPTIVGQWSQSGIARYTHEAVIVSYPDGLPGLPGPREIIYAFYIYGNGGVDILDATDKSNIVRLAVGTYPNMKGPHQGWLSDDKQYLYVDDELDEGIGAPPSVTRILDVSNPSAPFYVSSVSSGRPSIDHNLYVKGNLLFESNYTSGLRVFDKTNPSAPTQVAYFDSYPDNDGPTYNGNWGNYPYFASGTIILSDMQSGMFVLRLDLDYLSFSYPTGRPASVPPQTPTTIRVHVESAEAGDPAASVQLHTSINGAAFAVTNLIGVGGDDFEGTLPPAPCLATIDYFITASDGDGDTFTDPPNGFYSVDVYSAIITSVSDEMEAESGWTVGAPDDTATSGIWNRMDPQPTSAQPGDDHTDAPGVLCWVTNGNAGSGAGDFDVDGGRTTLTSPAFDLGGTPEARIGYWRWYSNSGGGAPNSDTFTIQVSNNNGSSWALVETVGPVQDASGGWIYHEFRVADILSPTSTVKVRFLASDNGAGSLVEAAIDDLRIFTYDCQIPCAVDWDDNGSVGSSDITAFLQDWFADLVNGTRVADFNNDLTVG
ncbi:MAG: choice-of-anchor B family protein, partial [Phycisphaerales bacterium]|nr:choice-of-anchor B family protein [Phycisphaerales bacterium]